MKNCFNISSAAVCCEFLWFMIAVEELRKMVERGMDAISVGENLKDLPAASSPDMSMEEVPTTQMKKIADFFSLFFVIIRQNNIGLGVFSTHLVYVCVYGPNVALQTERKFS